MHQDIEIAICKTICAFLNCKGGEIYIGITDSLNQVFGVFLTHKQQDDFTRFINSLCNNFEPQLSIVDREVEVIYLPVRDRQNNWSQGCWVPKIKVKQGSVTDKFYSFTYKDNFYCFIRLQNQCQ